MSIHLKLAQFEGPLELLLSLIEERKLDITKVSLAEVADQYLARLESDRASISLENLASFLVIAARLILIKSKMLLPVLEFTDEEEDAIEDLELQLLRYKRYKEASGKIGALLVRGSRSFPREKFVGAKHVYVPPKGLIPETLRVHFSSVLGEIPDREPMIEEVIESVVSLEERITALQESLRERAECTFRELSVSAENQMDLIVSFLAVLELVKQRHVSAEQGDVFGEIRISISRKNPVSIS